MPILLSMNLSVRVKKTTHRRTRIFISYAFALHDP